MLCCGTSSKFLPGSGNYQLLIFNKDFKCLLGVPKYFSVSTLFVSMNVSKFVMQRRYAETDQQFFKSHSLLSELPCFD